MAIQSFLVYTKPGCGAQVMRELERLPGAECTMAKNRDLVILVTESTGKRETQLLEQAMEAVFGIDGFALVAGYSDELIQAEEQRA